MTIRAVHISDFHLSQDRLFEAETLILQPLFEDLDSFHEDKPIDIVVVSGDMIDKGGFSFGSAQEAFLCFEQKVIKPIEDRYGLDRSRIIICPGNHDIERNKDSKYTNIGMRDDLSDSESVSSYLRSEIKDGIKRMDSYIEFERTFYVDANDTHPMVMGRNHILNINGIKIGISSANSSWRCYDDNDSGNLLIGHMQALTLSEGLKDCDLKLFVVHHPMSDLCEFDRDDISSVVFRNYDMMLSGHTHRGDQIGSQGIEGSLYLSVCPGNMKDNILSDNRRYSNGYRIIDVVVDDKKIISYSRRYNKRANRFDADTDLGDKNGAFEAVLPSQEKLDRKIRTLGVINKIKDSQDSLLDEHLLTYGTDTGAPKSLRDIFVTPEIVYRVKDKTDESNTDETKVSVEDICSSPEDIMIMGAKEIGKTVLLDRIQTRMTDEANLYEQIPIRIDFDKIGNRDIMTSISTLLSISRAEADLMCKNHNVTLLIDNIEFLDENKYSVKSISEFRKSYELSRIVCTYLQEDTEPIPRGFVDNSYDLEFKPITLVGFKTRQIKELVRLWFRDTSRDSDSHVKNVVSLFSALDIPHTPLAVSIFLWILEKQEDFKPTNEAVMIESFIDRIFRKGGKFNFLSEKFDFHNKQYMLAEIAHHILVNDNKDYSMSYVEMVKFCDDYIKERSFEFEAVKILDHFINNGVLTRENDLIRFRYKCFFEFFLMKKMHFDPTFKEFVLAEENYTMFHNEIKYYTGIFRNDKTLLSMVVSRMEAAYKEPSDYLLSVSSSLDSYFDSVKSIVKNTDEQQMLDAIERYRPTEDEMDEMDDDGLESLRSKGIKRKETPLSPLGRLWRILLISCYVLKNTEEIDDSSKKESYYKIIYSVAVYTVIFRYAVIDMMSKNPAFIPDKLKGFMDFMADSAPVVTQLMIHQAMGTKKLHTIYRHGIEHTMARKDLSEMEKFFHVFLYSDSKGKEYEKYISKFIKQIKYNYMESSVLLKIMSYYYTRVRSLDMENRMLDLIGDLIVKSRGLKPHQKGQIIAQHKRKKLRLKASESKGQMGLDL